MGKDEIIYMLVLLLSALVIGSSVPVTCTDPSYVSYHNSFRILHGVPLLQYDTAIETSAQNYANSMSPDGSGCNTHSSGTGNGENLAWTSSTNPTADSSYLGAVQSWYSEVKNYNYGTGATNGGAIGHFTQVTWKASTMVGCGRSQGAGGTCTVCQYNPPGNYVGNYIPNVLDCDTNLAYKCPTTKKCIPLAERCNAVTNQCQVGNDVFTGSQFVTASDDDESGCSSTTATPACSSTDGSTATTVSCACNAGSCASFNCAPGPGAGTTCLAGQSCKASSSECLGTSSTTPAPPSRRRTNTDAPTNAPTPPTTAAPTTYTATVTSTLSFTTELTSSEKTAVKSAFATTLTNTFASVTTWTVTLTQTSRRDSSYAASASGESSSNAITFQSAVSSASPTLTASMSTAIIAVAASLSDVSPVSPASSTVIVVNNNSSDGMSGGIIAAIVICTLVAVAAIAGLAVFFLMKSRTAKGSTSGITAGEPTGVQQPASSTNEFHVLPEPQMIPEVQVTTLKHDKGTPM